MTKNNRNSNGIHQVERDEETLFDITFVNKLFSRHIQWKLFKLSDEGQKVTNWLIAVQQVYATVELGRFLCSKITL